MIKKSGIVRISLFSVLFSLLFPSSYAASSPADILQLPIGVYSFLSKNLLGLASGSQNSVMFARFLIGILVYIILYVVASGIFPQSQGMRNFVPLILAIISTVLIPPDVLLGIFKTYTIVAVFFIWIIPPLGAFWFAHKVKQNLGDGPIAWFFISMVYLILIVIIPQAEEYLSSNIDSNSIKILDWFTLIWFILVFAFCHAVIILLRTMIYGHEAIPLGAGSQKWGQSAGGAVGSAGRGIWNRLRGSSSTPSGITDAEGEAADVERDVAQTVTEEKKELKDVLELEQLIEKPFTRYGQLSQNRQYFLTALGDLRDQVARLEQELMACVQRVEVIFQEEAIILKLIDDESERVNDIVKRVGLIKEQAQRNPKMANVLGEVLMLESKAKGHLEFIKNLETQFGYRIRKFLNMINNYYLTQIRANINAEPSLLFRVLDELFSRNNQILLREFCEAVVKNIKRILEHEEFMGELEKDTIRLEEMAKRAAAIK